MSTNESFVILKFGNMHPDYLKPGVSVKACLTIGASRYQDLVNEAKGYGSEGEMSFVGVLDTHTMQSAEELSQFISGAVTDTTFKKEVKAMGNKVVFIAECSKAVKEQPFTKFAMERMHDYEHCNHTASLTIDLMPKINELYLAAKDGKISKLEGSYVKLGMNADPKFLSGLLKKDNPMEMVFSYILSIFKYLRIELDVNSNLDAIFPTFITDFVKMPWTDILGEMLEGLKQMLAGFHIQEALKNAGPKARVIMCIPPCFSLEVDIEVEGIAELIS
jgi:hypothetical protein